MPQEDIYKLIVIIIMRLVLIFDITNSIHGMLKSMLVYCKSQKQLKPSKFETYIDLADTFSSTITILPIPKQTTINLVSLQLSPSVQVVDAFTLAFFNSFNFQFIASKDLFNAEHTYQYIQAIIQLNKAFILNLGPYWLDFLVFLILFITAINNIVVGYLRLPLKQAYDFHQTNMEYKICHPDIITAQVANWVSALKATLQCLEKYKAKRIEQLTIIEAIKSSNLAMEEKVKGKKKELIKMTTSYTSNSSASDEYFGGSYFATVQVLFLRRVVTKDNLDNKKETAMIKAMMKAQNPCLFSFFACYWVGSLVFLKYKIYSQIN